MKMNKPYIEIVRFDAEDVIATSGVCAVRPFSTENKILHYDYHNQNYFVYDYGNNTKTLVDDDPNYNPKLKHNGQEIDYTSVTKDPGTSTTGAGYSAYIFKDGAWSWWNEDSGSHGNY